MLTKAGLERVLSVLDDAERVVINYAYGSMCASCEETGEHKVGCDLVIAQKFVRAALAELDKPCDEHPQSGCGKPGHTTESSPDDMGHDDETGYCLTCELQAENERLKARVAEEEHELRRLFDLVGGVDQEIIVEVLGNESEADDGKQD